MPHTAESDWTLAIDVAKEHPGSRVQITHISTAAAQESEFRVAASIASEQLNYAANASEHIYAMHAEHAESEQMRAVLVKQDEGHCRLTCMDSKSGQC